MWERLDSHYQEIRGSDKSSLIGGSVWFNSDCSECPKPGYPIRDVFANITGVSVTIAGIILHLSIPDLQLFLNTSDPTLTFECGGKRIPTYNAWVLQRLYYPDKIVAPTCETTEAVSTLVRIKV